MKKALAPFVIVVGIAIVAFSVQNHLKTRSKTPTATINNHILKLEIAKTSREKGTGLSARKTLEKDFGMLFLFEKPGYYPFWMKNMKFSIDIIFIRYGRIVTIHKNVKPPIYPNENPLIYNSSEPADAVLEINAGLSEKHNFKEADTVKLENV